MLQSIKEDEGSQLVSLSVRKESKRLKSSCKNYLDLLRRKLKEIQGPKVKFPQQLVEYFKSKKSAKNEVKILGFPCIEDVAGRLKLLGSSTVSRRACLESKGKSCTPNRGRKINTINVTKI